MKKLEDMAQEVTLVFQDGTRWTALGRAFCVAKDVSKLRGKEIILSKPFKLPPGCYFSPLKELQDDSKKPKPRRPTKR